MWCHALSFNQLDEVEGVQMKSGSPRTDPGDTPHSRRVMSGRTEHRDERILRPTKQIRPKSQMRVAVNAEGLLQTLQRDVVIGGVKGCR